MDFARLPDEVFLKIIEYVPWKERIRAGRVNKSFRRIAQFVTSRTKSFSMWNFVHLDGRLRNISTDQLGVILDLCSSNLEKASLDFDYGLDDVIKVQLATKFANYQYPRLADLYVGDAPIGNAVFDQLIRNAPNVESLMCSNAFVVFPAISLDKLTKLMLIGDSNDATLQSLTDRCPNLKKLKVDMRNTTADVLDNFFASVPQLNRLEISQSMEPNIELENLENLWQLPLTSLTVDFQPSPPGDDFMYLVSESFPNLQQLTLERCVATDDGVAALGDLQELEILELYEMGTCDDEGISELANCKKLRKLDTGYTDITGATLIALLRGCPQLEYIGVCEIYQVDTPKEAVAVLESLSGIAKREITIKISPQFDGADAELKRIWKTKPVKKAIEKLEEIEGLKIKIEWGERFNHVNYDSCEGEEDSSEDEDSDEGEEDSMDYE